MDKKAIIFLFLFVLFSTLSAISQSALLEDGIGGAGFYIETVVDDNGINSVGGTASYSIGGIMDFGVNLITEADLIDDNESTNIYFSLLYNLIVIKQNQNQPINIQLQGAYGYMNTNSDYLDYYKRSRTGQGFEFGAALFHNFFSSKVFGFTLGGKMNYKNYINTTSDYTDPDLPETVSELRFESVKYGGFAGITLRPELWPILNLELQAMYIDDEGRLEYCPLIRIINPDF